MTARREDYSRGRGSPRRAARRRTNHHPHTHLSPTHRYFRGSLVRTIPLRSSSIRVTAANVASSFDSIAFCFPVISSSRNSSFRIASTSTFPLFLRVIVVICCFD